MADLKIPKVNKNTGKYIFKKKLPLRRKSKRALFIESAFMFFLGSLLVYINYLIPNKILLLENIPVAFNRLLVFLIEFSSMLPQILLVIFIFTSMVISLFLLLGSFYRFLRIFKRKTKKVTYK